MKILVFNPYDPDPRICEIDGSVQSALDVTGGERLRFQPLVDGLVLFYNPDADTPNREIDGHVVPGTFFLCRRDGGQIVGVPRRAVEHYLNYCRWPLAQGAVGEGA